MAERVLQDGTIVKELEKVKILEVKTKCPEKWKLIDLETGEVYIGYHTDGLHSWRKIDNA
jgi:hypothetical protein